MAAPIAGVAVRYIVIRGGVAVTRTVMKQYGKRTARKRMQKAAAKRGGKALAPAPQGPYGSVPRKSRGGEHTASSGTPVTRKSRRGPSAQKRTKASGRSRSTYFRRDEERYRYAARRRLTKGARDGR